MRDPAPRERKELPAHARARWEPRRTSHTHAHTFAHAPHNWEGGEEAAYKSKKKTAATLHPHDLRWQYKSYATL